MKHQRLKLFVNLWIIILIIALNFQPASVYAQNDGTVWFVSQAGDGTNGSNWEHAFPDLQEALSNALAGDQIWVAAGVYTPGTTREASFYLVPGVALYGGFSGAETLLEDRDLDSNITILSGDISGDDLNTDNNFIAETYTDIVGENSYHVIYADGTTGTPITKTTILDGFVITAGQANNDDGDYPHYYYGGGMYCDGSGEGNQCNPTLANLKFSGNIAGFGGALYNRATDLGVSSPTLRKINFIGNRARGGGAVFNRGFNGGVSSPDLMDVNFSNNSVGPYGGNGGAFYSSAGENGVSNPLLVNVRFIGNQSDDLGGAIYIRSYSNGTSSPILQNIEFLENSALGDGGALLIRVEDSGTSAPVLENILFVKNFSDYGGAVETSNDGGVCDPSFLNVSFVGNHVELYGGAFYNYAANTEIVDLSITNVILWGNTASEGDQFYNRNTNIEITTSLVEGGINGDGIYNNSSTIIDGGGNISDNPLFVDVINDDYHLQPSSPAIDSGTNGVLTTQFDLDGNLRIQDGDRNGLAVVDMGAYEFSSVPLNAFNIFVPMILR